MNNNKKFSLGLIIIFLLAFVAFVIVETTKKPRVLPESPAVQFEGIEAVQAANVMITSTNVTIDGTNVKHGTGVLLYEEIFGEDTYYTVVTNAHVITHSTGVNLIKVTDVYNNIYEAQIIEGSNNQPLDLVLLRFLKSDELITVSLANSLTASELVVAIGFNQQEYKVTYGTVEQVTSSTIIHNAESFPGFSGGGLYNSNLQIVGINSQIITDPENNQWIRSISISVTVLKTYLEGLGYE
jgi:S1-C subfamily serine protease